VLGEKEKKKRKKNMYDKKIRTEENKRMRKIIDHIRIKNKGGKGRTKGQFRADRQGGTAAQGGDRGGRGKSGMKKKRREASIERRGGKIGL